MNKNVTISNSVIDIFRIWFNRLSVEIRRLTKGLPVFGSLNVLRPRIGSWQIETTSMKEWIRLELLVSI